ncbi:MAG: type I-F CRISPR-associated endoribonuclease Cas6/Csy4 [Methylococcaceae bacterium]|nr:type I-F CRISPR-associated endoribonuclease Cas6/Csy4 [Methylococcaceae bacterium]
MDYFVGIKIKPDAEMRENLLLNKVYSKLHKALHSLNSTSIGVSFPAHKIKLGDIIRLHSTDENLTELQNTNWLGGLSGYCDVSEILAVPDQVKGYRVISRKQSTMNLRKLEKRVQYQKEQGVLKTQDEIKAYEKQYKAKMYASGLDNPYLELESSSNGHKHRRYIQFGAIGEQAVKGTFDTFGLSKTATVPWF